MHKAFYASGFLFHLKTQQILLYQPDQKNNIPSLWSMIGGDSREEEDSITAFQRVMYDLLNVRLNIKNIYPVYDYFHHVYNKTNYVFYTEVAKAQSHHPLHGGNLLWFTFKQTLKLPLTDQTKHDIVITERVIKAKARENEAKICPEILKPQV